MKDASQYSVTFGYGATDGVYYAPTKAQSSNPGLWLGPYHRGDDRAMPVGTPVIVNGVQIGLSGNGNRRYGAHLHIGRFVNGADTNPNGGGFTLSGARVVTVVDNYSTDPVNAKYVRIQDSYGAQWIYLHMSQINVIVGQELKGETKGGEDMPLTEDEFYRAFRMMFLRNPTQAEAANPDFRNLKTLVNTAWNNGGENNFNTVPDVKKINDIRAKFLKEIGQAVGLDPDKDGLEAIVSKVKSLR